MAQIGVIETTGPRGPIGEDGGRPITGRTVLAWLVGFFSVVFAANAALIWLALSSFSGLETASAYKAGRGYDREIAAAEAQAARDWSVVADLVRQGADADIRITMRDAAGAPIPGLVVTARLNHLARADFDHAVMLTERESGLYVGRAEGVPAGTWTFVIEAEGAEAGALYRSRSRVTLGD